MVSIWCQHCNKSQLLILILQFSVTNVCRRTTKTLSKPSGLPSYPPFNQPSFHSNFIYQTTTRTVCVLCTSLGIVACTRSDLAASTLLGTHGLTLQIHSSTGAARGSRLIASLNLGCHHHESLLYIGGILGRSLNELNAQRISKLLHNN